MSYQQEYQQSLNNKIEFWAAKASALSWFKPPQTILSKDANGIDRWFADGELNTAYLALDYHIEQGRGDQAAVIYDSPVTNTIESISYSMLRDRVALLAGVLTSLGINQGDRVLIYLPMIPQAVIAMLACARIGAIHSVVFGGFAAQEIASRIDDATPDVILTASCGIEFDNIIPYLPIVDQAIALATHHIKHCVVYQRQQHHAELKAKPTASVSDNTVTYSDWQALLDQASPADCVMVKATDPLYILYTSGTTGKPKGVVRDNGGHAVALHYSMKAIYNIEPGEVFWAASDVGWVVGHSYIVYGPLIAGCTTVLYEGKPIRTPDAGAFWRVCEQHKVKAIFSAPTAFRAIKKADANGKYLSHYDLSHLQAAFLAGERTDPATFEWLSQLLDKPIIDHWWQTETGWSIAASMTGIESLPCKAGSASLPVPGFELSIVDDTGNRLAANQQGNILLKLPLPPSSFPTLWNDFDRYQASYLSVFPGFYLTGDGGYFDEQGYLFVMGRTDDVINVAGHRFSTGEMEEVVASHSAIAECAVIGIHDSLRGQVPIAMVIVKDGIASENINRIPKEIIALVREKIGAVAYLKQALVVKRLPKTRSGKILRNVLRQLADGENFRPPSTIDDPEALTEMEKIFKDYKVGFYQSP